MMNEKLVNEMVEVNEELTAENLDNVSGGILISVGAVALVSGLYAAAIGTSYGLAKVSYNNAKRK